MSLRFLLENFFRFSLDKELAMGYYIIVSGG